MTIAPAPDAFATGASPQADDDRRFMRLALALAARHLGRTWPNPSVGAVVVRDDGGGPVIVGVGATRPGGRPHAERVALAEAGEAARGATLYVSLEPCSHHGATPPCAEAVVAAGVARVVSAVADPDPRVAGRGHALLREAGIVVDLGVRADEAARLNRGHFTRVRLGRPFVTIKLAQTSDGFAGRRAGARLVITGEGANARVHLMRAHADAMLVGIGTVLADDPLLTVRLPGMEPRSPVRIVLDGRLRCPPNARLVATAREVPTWIVTTTGASVEAERRLTASGVEITRVAAGEVGRVDLAVALRLLAERGITRLFCEGGPGLSDALANQGFADEIVMLTGAVALSEEGLPAIGPGLRAAMDRDFATPTVQTVGADRLQTFARTAA